MLMSGRIKVGLWLPFTAEQTVDGRSFVWRARVGRGPLTPLRVTDRYEDAAGSTEGRLLGRFTLFHAEDINTARSAATRAAIESVVFAPPSTLPGRGVTWLARGRSGTSPSEEMFTLSAASATWCSRASSASAGGLTPRATRRSSAPRSTRSRRRSERREGQIPDVDEAVASPRPLTDDATRARGCLISSRKCRRPCGAGMNSRQ
jgi:hypothetical protein